MTWRQAATNVHLGCRLPRTGCLWRDLRGILTNPHHLPRSVSLLLSPDNLCSSRFLGDAGRPPLGSTPENKPFQEHTLKICNGPLVPVTCPQGMPILLHWWGGYIKQAQDKTASEGGSRKE